MTRAVGVNFLSLENGGRLSKNDKFYFVNLFFKNK